VAALALALVAHATTPDDVWEKCKVHDKLDLVSDVKASCSWESVIISKESLRLNETV
jgi:hypothetical protein